MMPFTLKLSFDGLCLFVPDPGNGGGPVVHVLLINHGGKGHGHGNAAAEDTADRAAADSPHVAMLFVDPVNGSPATSGTSLKDAQVTLTNLTGARPSTDPLGPRRQLIPDLDFLASCGKLDPAWVRGTPGPEVAARVTLEVGALDDPPSTGFWNFVHSNGTALGTREVGDDSIWAVTGLTTDHATVEITPLRGGGASSSLTITPSSEQLRIVCLPPEYIGTPGPGRKPGQRAEHFGGFYSLFRRPIPEPTLLFAQEGRHPLHTRSFTTAQTTRCTNGIIDVGPPSSPPPPPPPLASR